MIAAAFDIRIHECEVGDGEYVTFRDARDAVVEYLESHIALCETTLAGIKSSDTYEQYLPHLDEFIAT